MGVSLLNARDAFIAAKMDCKLRTLKECLMLFLYVHNPVKEKGKEIYRHFKKYMTYTLYFYSNFTIWTEIIYVWV